MLFKEALSAVIKSQRDNLLQTDAGVLRDITANVPDSFTLIISGVRRCGKSTFLRQMIEKEKVWYFLNLEDPRLYSFELNDFNRIEEIMYELYGKGGTFFFDEIQNIPKWEKYIRFLVDNRKKVVITGSNASLLSQELATKLTGRHLNMEVFPFSFSEFLKLKKSELSDESLRTYLRMGGFPEYLKQENTQILNELLTDIVLKDIVVRYQLKNVDLVKKLALYLISNIGKEFSYNSLKNNFQIKAVQSVIDYIHYFENSYLIFTVQRFHYSYQLQQRSPKKVYSIDNGFSTANSISFSKDEGRMLENLVFLKLRKRYKEIFYFREAGECDFIVKEKEKITQAIQVCYDINDYNKDREINGLINALETLKLKTGIIITMSQTEELKIRNKTIHVISLLNWINKN